MSENRLSPGHLIMARHHITNPRHLPRFQEWAYNEHLPAWQDEHRDAVVQQYVSEKYKPLYYLTLYELAGGPSVDELVETRRALRSAWGPECKNMRDFTIEAYEPVWWSGRPPNGSQFHPTIMSRYSVEADRETAFDQWVRAVDAAYLADLPVANIRHYRAVDGDPRFQLLIQEFDDDSAMRSTIEANEPAQRPQYWDGWAEWMPCVNSLTRLVFNPSSGREFPSSEPKAAE